ncbi:MAG: TetR/AcrR family transcriptional regulator [Actinomycetota bacterium]
MSPRPPDPLVRTALIDAAARLLIEHGPDSLTTRRLASEVGTSTMAVYTYFKGMDELRSAVAREGFERLAQHLDAVTQTADSVADVAALGAAYFVNAIANPYLYHFMFLERPDDDPEVGHETFERLVAAVERAVEDRRFREADPWKLATQLWAMAHGIVTLHLSGLLSLEEATESFGEMGFNLFVAFGDDIDTARRSIEEARGRFLESDDETMPRATTSA